MHWANVGSAAELSERMDGAMTGPTLNNRIQGNHTLKPLEVAPVARALGVSEEVLRVGGPELPDPDDVHVHAVVTGRAGAWTLTVLTSGQAPQVVQVHSEEPPSLADLLGSHEATGDRLSDLSSTTQLEEEAE